MLLTEYMLGNRQSFKCELLTLINETSQPKVSAQIIQKHYSANTIRFLKCKCFQSMGQVKPAFGQ